MADKFPKEFIVYSPSKTSFEAMVASGEVDNTQIGIIAESGEFWENGNYHPLVMLTDYLKKTDAVALAKDLTGSIEATPEEFTFRPSAGSKSIRDESAVIRRIKGNTSVWGQYADNPVFANGTSKWNRVNTTLSIDTDGSMKVKHDTDGSQGFLQWFDDGHIPSGHKVLVVIDYKRSASTSKELLVYLQKESLGIFDIGRITVSSSSRRTDGIIITTTEPSASINIYPFIGGAVEDYTNVYSVNVFDLTAIFGAGNEPTTLEKFRELYPDSYYPYCVPEVRSMRATGIETIGANAFNKKSVVRGKLNADGTVTTNDKYSVAKIEVVPNEKYTLTNVANAYNSDFTYALYDSNDKFLSTGQLKYNSVTVITRTGDVTMPLNARYIRVVVHNDYLDSCCVNLKHSGTLTTEEATYFKEVRMLPDIAKYFPDGMHGIGGVYDEINENNVVKRFGVVDLGMLNWGTTGTQGNVDVRFYSAGLQAIAKGTKSSSAIGNIVNNRYVSLSADGTYLRNKGISIDTGGRLHIYDPAMTTADDLADMVASLQGVMLVYEIFEPVVTPITAPLQLDYKVADFGTEKMLSTLPSSPFRADIVYQFNAADRIRDNARNIERLEDAVADLPKQEDVVGKDDTINANMVSELAYAATGVAKTAPIIANRIPQLRADAFAFLQPDEFTVEQAFDGETWETLDSNTQMHRRLFTQENFNTGVEIHPSNGSWSVGSKIRITMYPKNARNAHVDFIAINMYCNGRAFDISGEYCAKNDDAPVWQDMLRTTSINDNGVVYLQYSNKFGYAAYSRWGIRLTFTITKNAEYYSRIQGISGFGSRVSEVSSTVSSAPYTLGTLWHWDYLKNITFPNGIKANSLTINGGSPSTLLQGDGTPVTKTSIDFDVMQASFVGPNNAWRSNGVWPILASQIDVYRANRLAFLQDDEYEVEMSADGGTTWTTSVKDDAMRRVFIGLNNGRIAIPSTTTDMMRITIKPNPARYSSITFFYMWVGCPSEGNTFAKIEYSTGAAPDTWNLHSTATIAGLSGPNMMKYGRLFGRGSGVANVRFTIYNTADHTIGTSVYGIQGHGSNAWGDINNMYQCGHLYSWDISQNAKFPAKVVASSFEDSNGNAVMLAKDIPTEVATATQRRVVDDDEVFLQLNANILYDYSMYALESLTLPALSTGDIAYDNVWMVRCSLLSSNTLTIPFDVMWKDGVAPSFSSWCILDLTFRKTYNGTIIGEWKIYK